MSKQGSGKVFTNQTEDGSNNLIGRELHRRRKSLRLSQRAFAEKLQISGLEIDKNAIFTYRMRETVCNRY